MKLGRHVAHLGSSPCVSLQAQRLCQEADAALLRLPLRGNMLASYHRVARWLSHRHSVVATQTYCFDQDYGWGVHVHFCIWDGEIALVGGLSAVYYLVYVIMSLPTHRSDHDPQATQDPRTIHWPRRCRLLLVGLQIVLVLRGLLDHLPEPASLLRAQKDASSRRQRDALAATFPARQAARTCTMHVMTSRLECP